MIYIKKVDKPIMEEKTYHWCSCGLSKKQPFCDNSHKGTAFRPVNFKLAEKCDKMLLCGCKLSQNTPFCDGKTCIKLKLQEKRKIVINFIEELESKLETMKRL